MGDGEPIARATRIERCPPIQTNVMWPVPVDQRLNELIERLADAGEGDTTRSRLLAALVAGAPTDLDELRKLLRKYGQLTAGKVVLQTRGPIERRYGVRDADLAELSMPGEGEGLPLLPSTTPPADRGAPETLSSATRWMARWKCPFVARHELLGAGERSQGSVRGDFPSLSHGKPRVDGSALKRVNRGLRMR